MTFATAVRSISFSLSRGVGAFRRWLNGGWRPFLLGFAATAVLFWLARTLFHLLVFPDESARDPISIAAFLVLLRSHGWTILSLFALLLVLGWAWRSRARVVVDEFVDHTRGTGEANGAKHTASGGLSTLLVLELARLRDLFRAVDEQRPIATSAGAGEAIPFDPAIKVEDMGEVLRTAVSAESEFKLGGFSIPVGSVMALVGKLLQGPRILGSLHAEPGCRILAAQMVGGRHRQSWRVDDGGTGSLQGLVEELAYRMFTDVVLRGTVRWRATKSFTEGLRAYRDGLRTPKDRPLNLGRAERAFIAAIGEDAQFDLAYYNLGVVYTELGQPHAAEVSFQKAISLNPQCAAPYYALALSRYRSARSEPQRRSDTLASVVRLCKRVIALCDDGVTRAEAWDLMGMAQRHLEDLPGSIDSRSRAVALAWSRLCRAARDPARETDGDVDPAARLEQLASRCLLDLAVAHAYAGHYRRALDTLRQAISLSSSDPNLPFELGKIHLERQAPRAASTAFRAAIRIDPQNAEYWAYLALAAARAGDRAGTRHAGQQVLMLASAAPREALAVMSEAYGAIEAVDEGDRMRELPAFLESLPHAVTELQRLEKNYGEAGRELEYGHVALTLGRAYATSDRDIAESWFREALATFQAHHADEVRRTGVRGELALVLAERRQLSEALDEAEQAISVNPIDGATWRVLGEVYAKLEDWRHAVDAWENALSWAPADHALHWSIGHAFWNLATDLRNREQRAEAFANATRYFHQALELARKNKDNTFRCWSHYWLARLHMTRMEYPAAIPHLRVIKSEGFGRLTAALLLGEAQFRNKAYAECARDFQDVLTECRRMAGAHWLNEPVGQDTGEPMALGAVLAWASWGLACSYAERGVRLEEALQLLDDARARLRGLRDPTVRERLEAALAQARGLVLLRQGRPDEAIESLVEAVSSEPDGECYLQLAQAYERKLRALPRGDGALIARVEDCCTIARQLDFDGHYAADLDALLARAREAALQPGPQPAPAAAAPRRARASSSKARAGKPSRRKKRPPPAARRGGA